MTPTGGDAAFAERFLAVAPRSRNLVPHTWELTPVVPRRFARSKTQAPRPKIRAAMSVKIIRVVVGDGNSLVREGVRSVLPAYYSIVGVAGTGSELITVASALKPDVCIIDACLQDDGIRAARLLRASLSNTKILILFGELNCDEVSDLLDHPGVAFVHRSEEVANVLTALNAILADQSYASPRIAADSRHFLSATGRHLSTPQLTDRQRQILQLVAAGRCNKEIAHTLELSVKTVEFHRGRIMDRVGVRTVAELTRFAITSGLTPPHM